MALKTTTKNKPSISKKDRYTEGVGRRKTSVARVRVFEKGTGIQINGKDYREYFPTEELSGIASQALQSLDMLGKIMATVHVTGGGIHSQAEAVRHGFARALLKMNVESQGTLRAHKLLTRDSRMKERRKFGLKKARRAPQWSKR